MTSSTEAVSELFEFLSEWPGHEPLVSLIRKLPDADFFAAGGVVRDAFFGRPLEPKDVDIFVAGCDEATISGELSQAGHLTIGSFGAFEWQPTGNTISCDIILIERFYNGLWKCRDMLDALNQFDCTINAIAVDLRTRALMNPQNGLYDIESRTMRAVRFDFPDEAFSAKTTLTRNVVLWWRIVHYALLFDLTIEPVTLDWLRRNRAYESSRGEFEREFHTVGDPTAYLT